MKPLTTPVLQARDLILETLLHRKNLVLTETVCRDAANNAATALIALLEDVAKGVPSDEHPPVRNIPSSICTHPVTEADGHCAACGDVTDWADAPEVQAIK